MRSKLFKESAKTVQLNTGMWVRIFPDEGDGYLLFDAVAEADLGRILFDADDNWIYDGKVLNVYDQEEVAGSITGHQQEMDELMRSI